MMCLCHLIDEGICALCENKREEEALVKSFSKSVKLKLKAFKELDRQHVMSELQLQQFGELFMELKQAEAFLFDEWFAQYVIDFYQAEENKKQKEVEELKSTLNIGGYHGAR